MKASLLVALGLLLLAPASADELIPKVIAQQPTAPIRVDRCYGDFLTAYGAFVDVAYTNTSRIEITLVRFGFTDIDGFGDRHAMVTGDVMATLDPGAGYEKRRVADDPGWRVPDHVECSVERVLFANGTVWKR